MERTLARYPIYVPSKGRHDDKQAKTVRFLCEDGQPFYLVVEPQEEATYAAKWGGHPCVSILTLPDNNQGVLFARQWIRQHSEQLGAARHWELDDNIRRMLRWVKCKRIRVRAGVALRCCEDFTDRYTNIGICGPTYEMFSVGESATDPPSKPFVLNAHVYSCSLVNNQMEPNWRLRYNEDTDLCLQVLAAGMCTVLFQWCMASKIRTMLMNGGNTANLYQGDGRCVMSRTLERQWPGVAYTERRYDRPAHVIKGSWKKFDNQLQRRTDIDWEQLEATNNYGMKVVERDGCKIRSASLRQIVEEG